MPAGLDSRNAISPGSGWVAFRRSKSIQKRSGRSAFPKHCRSVDAVQSSPRHRGVLIGTVERVLPGDAGVVVSLMGAPIKRGDGIYVLSNIVVSHINICVFGICVLK